jgi:hypothetical protein
MIHPIIEQSGIIHIFKGKHPEPIKLVIGEILTAEIMDIFPTGTIQIKINNRIINATPQRELPLNKGDYVMVKVEKPLEDGTIPLRLVSATEADSIKQAVTQSEIEISEKILKLIEFMFSQKMALPKETKQSHIVKAITSFPTENLSETQKAMLMQKIIDFILSNSRITENLFELMRLIELNNFSKEQISQLKNLIISSSNDLIPERLKEVLINSGVSFEAKIKQTLAGFLKIDQIKGDLQYILNNIVKEAKQQGMEEIAIKAEQILRQIEGYQIISKTYQSFFTFLPILWGEIVGGSFAYKSLKRQGKDCHTVFVNINFKEADSLFFIVTMKKKFFYITFSGNKEVLNLIKTYENELKEQFQQRGMFLSEIKYIHKFEEFIKQWEIKEGHINITV